MATNRGIWTGILLLLLILATLPVQSPAAVPTITRTGEDVLASWDLSTAENITLTNLTQASGKVHLINLDGRLDQGLTTLLTGTAMNLISSGGALKLTKRTDWWNANYSYRKPVAVHNRDGTTIPKNFTYNLTVDTQSLITAGKMRADLNDLRLIHVTNGSFAELDRAVESPNTGNTTVLFKGNMTLAPDSGWNSTYYIYYGYPTAPAPPQNKSKVFLYYDGFSTDTRAKYTSQNCLLDQNGGTATLAYDAVNGRMDMTASAAGPGITLIAPIQARNARIEANMRDNNYYRQGQRDSNFELVTRYTNVQNYYVETFSLGNKNPAVYKYVTGARTGPLTTSALANPALKAEHLVWFSTVNGTITGGINSTRYFNVVDNSLAGIGNLGIGISSGDGYIDNLTVRFDIERWPNVTAGPSEVALLSPGVLVSKPLAAGTVVTWNVINWTSSAPAGSNVILSTRTSPDAVKWTPWSNGLPTGAGSAVPSIPDRYLQFKAVLNDTGSLTSPSLSWVGANFSRYIAKGTLETKDISFLPVVGWTDLTVTQDIPSSTGGSIQWEASNNSGQTWKAVPSNGDLKSMGTSENLRLKATFNTGNTSQTPSLDYFALRLKVDNIPVLKSPLPPLNFLEDTKSLNAINLTTYFQDDEALAFTAQPNRSDITVTVHSNGSVDLAAITANWTGKVTVTFRATDSYGLFLEAKTEVTVTPVNDPPVILSHPPTKVMLGDDYTYTLIAKDGDGDPLTYLVEKGPSGLTIDASGKVVWHPTSAQLGSNSVNLSVADPFVKVYQAFVISVERVGGNHAPVIDTIPQGTSYVGELFQYKVKATDADNDTLKYSLDQAPQNMTMASATGIISWTPVKSQLGNAVVIVNVSDIFSSTKQSFTIVVIERPPNSAPVISGLVDLSLKKTIKMDLRTHASDKDDVSSNLTWNIDGYSQNLFTASITGTDLTITPVNGASGKGNITLVVKDQKGGSDKKTINVEIVKISSAGMSIWPFILLIILLVAVACIVASVWVYSKRKREREQAKMVVYPPVKAPVAQVVTHEKPVHVKPAEVKIDFSANIAKATELMTKILNASVTDDLMLEEKGRISNYLTKMEKDKVIKKASLDETGHINLEADNSGTLDDVAVVYGNLYDGIIRARYGGEEGKDFKSVRGPELKVMGKVLGDDKGPAAMALKRRLLQGAMAERVTSGVPGLDNLLGGGFPKGETILFQVPAGSVKDVLIEQILRESIRSNQGVIVSLSNTAPSKFLADSEKKGIKVKECGDLGELWIVDWHSYKTVRVKEVEEEGNVHRCSKSLTNLAIAITDASKGLKNDLVKRGVFDVITPAITIFGLDPTFKFLQSLVARLKESEFTSIFVIEKDTHDPEEIATIAQNFDAVVDIERKKDGRSVTMDVAVLSMSAPGYSSDIRKIEVTDKGLVVSDGR